MNQSGYHEPASWSDLPPLEPGEGWELRASQRSSNSKETVRLAKTLQRYHLVKRLKGDDLARALDHDGVAKWFQPGDQIWWWSSGDFSQLSGRAGYALRRQSKIVAAWLVIMN